MNLTTFLYLLPFIISTGISLAVGIYCWQRRRETGAMMYALVAFSQASWTIGYTLELLSPTLDGKSFWDNFQLIGGTGWLIAFLAFTLAYTGRHFSRPLLAYSLLAMPGIVLMLTAFINPLTWLIRSEAVLVPGEPFSTLQYDLALGYWLWGFYGYTMIFICLGLLGNKYLRTHSPYRTQMGLIFAGNLIPIIGTALTLTGIIHGPYRDISPLTFALGNLLVAWGLFRYGLFDLVPLAWDKVMESIPDSVVVLDTQDRVVNLNPAALVVTGRESSAVIGRPAQQVFANWSEIVAQYLEVMDTRAEMVVNTPEGPRYIEFRIHPLYDQRQHFKGRVLITRDFTDRKRVEEELQQHRDRLEELVKERTAELVAANQQLQQQIAERERLEERLRQAQKLEAIGSLAGGIAHDFNNLLVPILGYVELSLLDLAPESRLYANLAQVRKAAEQAANLTRQILAFSRQQVLELSILDLNVIVEEFKKMIQRLIGEDIELRTILTAAPYPVKADKGQIEQVLMNLAVNSRDAMPEGGRLTIETANVLLDEAYVQKYASDLPPGPYVMLAVSDTGQGMDAETQKRIFDPFFTTKESGKGTGLGLATVFGIVKQHQGSIWVYSEPGRGTTFKIYLPQAKNTAQPATTPPPIDGSLTSGTETVLVVEDEGLVRRLVCETLAAHGYDVVEASSPAACLRLAADKAQIHMLLTDVILPEMNGRELYQKLVAIHPGSKVLYMSGYTNNVIVHHGILEEDIAFLQKPFTVLNLTRKVREVLGASGGG